ncbi:MAG: NTP transferase domain-containing protein [Thermoplasmata archaeon]
MENTIDEPKTCVIMCGGRGSRINNPEKYLLQIGNETVIGRLIRMVSSLGLSVHLCTRDGTSIAGIYGRLGLKIIISSGNGYIHDMNECLNTVSILPILLIPGDIVLLSPGTLSSFMKQSAMVGRDLVNLVSNGEVTGITIFKRLPSLEPLSYSSVVTDDEIINVNTPEDYDRARKLLGFV